MLFQYILYMIFPVRVTGSHHLLRT